MKSESLRHYSIHRQCPKPWIHEWGPFDWHQFRTILWKLNRPDPIDNFALKAWIPVSRIRWHHWHGHKTIRKWHGFVKGTLTQCHRLTDHRRRETQNVNLTWVSTACTGAVAGLAVAGTINIKNLNTEMHPYEVDVLLPSDGRVWRVKSLTTSWPLDQWQCFSKLFWDFLIEFPEVRDRFFPLEKLWGKIHVFDENFRILD